MRSYEVKEIETFADKQGFTCTRVGVYSDRELVGSYVRNLEGTGPFFPFLQAGKEYALYSPNYTTTSVMSLPDCKLVASEPEDPMGIGYCPLSFHVPTSPAEKAELLKTPYVDHVGGMWGVVSGCYWGAEWYSPIQYLDLSRISEGAVSRDDRFGSLQAPRKVPLKDCLDLWGYTKESPAFSVLASMPVDLRMSLDIDPRELASEILHDLDGVRDHSRRISILETRLRNLLRWDMKG